MLTKTTDVIMNLTLTTTIHSKVESSLTNIFSYYFSKDMNPLLADETYLMFGISNY